MKKFLTLLLSMVVLILCASTITSVAIAAESVTIGDVTIEVDTDGVYIIDDVTKFEAVFSESNTSNTDLLTGGNTFKQTASFTLSNSYYPVNVGFAGVYDGNGYTVTLPNDLTITANNFALFKNLSGATIKKLTVDSGDGTVKFAKGWAAVFAGNVNASTDNYITDCTNNVNISSTQSQIAGFVTSAKGNITLTNCTNNGNISAKKGTGAFVYNNFTTNNVTLVNCINNGNITGSDAGTSGFVVAGSLGVNKISFDGCINNGDINGTSFVSGFLTGTAAIYNPASFENCTNNGSVTGSANQVGGFVTRIDKSTFTNCTNKGTITGTGDVGGFMGQSNGQFTKCINSGKITATGSSTHSGGFIGGINGGNNGITFTLCANTGDVVSKGNAGGFVPYIGTTADVTFDRCYNEGNINSWSMRGGFIGQAQGYSTGKNITVTVKDCYNAGYIQGSNDGKGSLFGSIDSETDSATYNIDNFYDAFNPVLDIIGTAKANDNTTVTYNDVYILNASSDSAYDKVIKATAEMLTDVPETFTEGVWAVNSETGYPYIQLVENQYIPGNDVTINPVKGTYVFTGTTTTDLSDVEGIEDVKTPYAIVAAKFAYNNTVVLGNINYGVLISETVSGTDLNIDTCDKVAEGNKNSNGRYGILIYNVETDKTYYVRPYVEYNGKYWYGDADSFTVTVSE